MGGDVSPQDALMHLAPTEFAYRLKKNSAEAGDLHASAAETRASSTEQFDTVRTVLTADYRGKEINKPCSKLPICTKSVDPPPAGPMSGLLIANSTSDLPKKVAPAESLLLPLTASQPLQRHHVPARERYVILPGGMFARPEDVYVESLRNGEGRTPTSCFAMSLSDLLKRYEALDFHYKRLKDENIKFRHLVRAFHAFTFPRCIEFAHMQLFEIYKTTPAMHPPNQPGKSKEADPSSMTQSSGEHCSGTEETAHSVSKNPCTVLKNGVTIRTTYIDTAGQTTE